MKTKVLSTHIPVEISEKVDRLSERLDRSRGWVVKKALKEYLEMEEERYRLTLEGLSDVKAGRIVSHSEVQSWIQSLGTEHELSPPKCD